MDISKVAIGKEPPKDINVIIEVPMHVPIKYELDKDSGAVFVDRFIATPMTYPCNYGFIPGTLSDDGDPADALVLGQFALTPGSVIRARPVGVLMMEDEAGKDEKLICVPHAKMTPLYSDLVDVNDIPASLRDQIQHFFEHYKDLEKGKWVKVTGWESCAKAESLIEEAIKRVS
ncbi:MAG: inorganic diphosphatase [Pseudomonadota bacterium]